MPVELSNAATVVKTRTDFRTPIAMMRQRSDDPPSIVLRRPALEDVT